MPHCTHGGAQRTADRVSTLLPLCGFWESNSGCQNLWQRPLPLSHFISPKMFKNILCVRMYMCTCVHVLRVCMCACVPALIHALKMPCSACGVRTFRNLLFHCREPGVGLWLSGVAAGTCTCWATWTTHNLSVSSTVQSYLLLKVKTIRWFLVLIMFESRSLITYIHYYTPTRPASLSPSFCVVLVPVYRLDSEPTQEYTRLTAAPLSPKAEVH